MTSNRHSYGVVSLKKIYVQEINGKRCFYEIRAQMFNFHQKKDHYGMLVDARNVEATFVQRYIEIDEFFYGTSDDVSLEIEQSTKERGKFKTHSKCFFCL